MPKRVGNAKVTIQGIVLRPLHYMQSITNIHKCSSIKSPNP